MPPERSGSATSESDPPRPYGGRAAWWLFGLALVLGAAVPYFAQVMNANERPRILQAIAFVDTGELAVDGPGARGIDPGIDVARSPADGRLYPNKPPGAALAAAAGYVVVRAGDGPVALRDVTRMARWLGGLLPTIVLCAFMLRRHSRRHDPRVVTTSVVLYAIATPVASYARLLFGHQLTACLLAIGTALLFDAARSHGRPRPMLAFVGGLLAAASIGVEYTAVFAGLPLGAWLGWRAWRDREPAVLVSAIGGALVPVLALAAYHHAVFGSAFATGYHHVVDRGFSQIHGRGLLGLSWPTPTTLFEHLMSPWGGLFYWAPLVALAIGLAVARFRRLDEETRLSTAIFLTLLLVTMGLSQTGGWRVGPRYLVAAFPLAVPALVVAIEAARRHRLLGIAIVALAVWSAAINLLAAHLFPHLIPGGNPFGDLLVPLLLGGYAPYSVLAPILGGEVPALVAMLGLGMLLVAYALWRVGFEGPQRVRTSIVGALAGILCLLAALALPASSTGEANLDAVQNVWEPRAGGSRVTIELGELGSRL